MEFILLASAHFLALLSPGPDFFLIMQAAFRLDLRYSVSLCFGIAAANAVYLSFAITGLELVSQSSMIQQGLKYLGGGYLIFIGVMLLRTSRQPVCLEKERIHFLHEKSYLKQFYLGFFSGILNPKNAIFYLAIFSTMVSADTPLSVRSLYGLWMVLIVFIWDAMLALLIGAKSIKNKLGDGLYYIEKFSGVMLTLFGIFLSFS